MLFKIAYKSLINSKRFAFFFVVNLCVGLIAFVSISSFNSAIHSQFSQNSKAILGGDLSISARFELSDENLKAVLDLLPDDTTVTKVLSTYSMVQSGEATRLVQLKAVQSHYPLYGKLSTSPNNFLLDDTKVWVDPEVLSQLNTEVGKTLKVGNKKFNIAGTIVADPSSGLMSFWAPRVYIDLNQLLETNLIRKGSIVTHTSLFKFSSTDTNLKDLALRLENALNDPNIRVNTHENSSQQMSRMTSYLNDYLGLVALVALFLAALGSGFLFRTHLRSSFKDIAIFRSLGVSLEKASLIFIFQIVILSIFTLAPIVLFLPLIFEGILLLTSGFISQGVEFSYRWSDLALALLICSGGSLSICFPFIVKLKSIDLKSVLLESEGVNINFKPKDVVLFLPFLLLYWVLSVYVAKSYFVGSLFSVALVMAFLFLCVVAVFAIRFFGACFQPRNALSGLSFSYIRGNKLSSLIIFSVIGICCLLLQFIPQVQYALNAEISQPDNSELPSFFLFDIQEDQLDPLRNLLLSLNHKLDDVSPFIRSKLISVNGKSFEGISNQEEVFSREAERERRFRSRGFNLSYRQELSSSENLLSGRAFSGEYGGDGSQPAEISIETRYAKRLGFEIGDTLVFDVQGIEVPAKIVNLRKVKWTSFRPNFFIQFQKGVLEAAPKTFVAVIDNLDFSERVKVQNAIVSKLPNISIVDVTKLISKIQNVIDQLGSALFFMAVVIFVCGVLVIYTVTQQQIRVRSFDINLLKVLGLERSQIEKVFLQEVLMLSLFACFVGTAVCLLFSYFASVYFFEASWKVNFSYVVAAFVVVNLMVFVSTKLILQYILRQNSKHYL